MRSIDPRTKLYLALVGLGGYIVLSLYLGASFGAKTFLDFVGAFGAVALVIGAIGWVGWWLKNNA
jgi:hypothetical protein